jgi:hypothetical protein
MPRPMRSAALLITGSLTFLAFDAPAQDAAKDVQSQLDAQRLPSSHELRLHPSYKVGRAG